LLLRTGKPPPFYTGANIQSDKLDGRNHHDVTIAHEPIRT